MEKHNHLYPKFHIRKWIDCNGQVYDKELNKENKCRGIVYKKDFTKDFYYSLGKVDNKLEKRLSTVETTIAPLIDKIDKAEESVLLSVKELELLKIYCVLCASRHENTCEVIKSDESDIYRSNNYLLGVHRNLTQTEAVDMTAHIVEEFDRIKKMPEDMKAFLGNPINMAIQPISLFTTGLHLTIVRSQEPILFISDRFCIIENTMDSDHLYTYIPISPKTALLLVKSKYYYDEKAFIATKKRFGEKYGNGEPDEYLSELFGAEVDNCEDVLFCDYYSQEKLVQHIKTESHVLYVKIHSLRKEYFRLFNSIYCEDGRTILFCDKGELDFALTHPLQCREIEMIL